MNTPLRSTQPTRSKELEETRRKDTDPTTNHTIGWELQHGIVKVFFSSIFYRMVLQSMLHITHHSFIGYILLFWRNVAGNLGVVCCFFTSTHLFTSSISRRLIFSTQASPNWIILHILQVLHTAIIICSQI